LEQYVDALREIGNIGIGNAVTALAQFLNIKVSITVPQASFVPIEGIFDVIGDVEAPAAAVVQRVEGNLSGTMMFLFPEQNALEMVTRLLEAPPGSITEIDEMGQSVLMEVGNILTGCFLTAIGGMTRLTFIPAVPMFTFDMLGSIISSSLLCTGMVEDKVLLIETEIFAEECLVSGDFAFFFDIGSLATLLTKLGL
jgi:chemotaxis protein CheC